MSSPKSSESRIASHPYSRLPGSAFWRSGVTQASPFEPQNIYVKKWVIEPNGKIATAGSCFAQHISSHLKGRGFNVLDLEPPPSWLPENRRKDFGYSQYSARYGNIYTAQQLLQLAKEAAGQLEHADIAWSKQGRFYDALRPTVEPDGFESIEELKIHRRSHIARVREMLETMDVFIFTLGLTEAWIHKAAGTVYPIAPGVIAGDFDADAYAFKTYDFNATLDALLEFQHIVDSLRNGAPSPKLLLTVSPIPLTATASGKHVLQATTYSKSVLRAVSGQLCNDYEHVDYFPSYEIIMNPAAHGAFFDSNLRSVRSEGVVAVMRCFFAQHNEAVEASMRPSILSPPEQKETMDFAQCEEQLLGAFHG